MSNATQPPVDRLSDWFRKIGTGLSREDYEEGLQALAARGSRVQAAEAERDEWKSHWEHAGVSMVKLAVERDEARGKLAAARERVKFHLSGQRNGSGISFILDDVLAILDGDNGR